MGKLLLSHQYQHRCEFWKQKLCRIHGFFGSAYAFTDDDCMRRAMCVFISVYNYWMSGLNFGVYWHLVTLYQSVLVVEHDQRMNEYGRAVMKRYKFLLKHSHCNHYGTVHFPDQTEYILQRKSVLAMSLHPRPGTHSLYFSLGPASN